jgi:transcriptional regulator with XRE-family HTH domain
MTIGQRITLLRTGKALSRYELAKQAGVPASTLHYLEEGTRDGKRLSLDTASRLARVLGVTLGELAGLSEERSAGVRPDAQAKAHA